MNTTTNNTATNLTTNTFGETSTAPYEKFAKRYFSGMAAPIAAMKMMCDAIYAEDGDDMDRQGILAIASDYGITYNTASTQYNRWKNEIKAA